MIATCENARPFDSKPALVNAPNTSTSSPFANRSFRLLFGGSSVSAIGDQFTLVAMPWLVLRLTGDPAVLGQVLATIALPVAIFMLIGGAIVDRFSARGVLLLSRSANCVLVALLAALVLSGPIAIGAVYAIAFGIGLAQAFSYPAATSLLPQLLAPAQLPAANAMFMGVRQLAFCVGPVLAGLVIAGGDHGAPGDAAPSDLRGLGIAFAIDATSFLFSLGALWLVRPGVDRPRVPPTGGVLASVGTGVRDAWRDVPFRAFLLYAAAVTILVGGPMQVGLPVLAATRLDLGAASLGILMASNGGGMIVGGLLSSWVLRRVRGRLGLLILSIDCCAGLGLAVLSQVHTTLAGSIVLACTGTLGGVAQIAVMSWVQQRTARERIGRTMSLLMFTYLGLGPLSAALCGRLLKTVPLTVLLAGAGLSLASIALVSFANPWMRRIGVATPPQGAGDVSA